MKNIKRCILSVIIIASVQLIACTNNSVKENDIKLSESNVIENKKDFTKTLEKHLSAVSNKDLATLKSTMSPEGKMQLILPGTEIINSVDSFMNFHEEWFQDTTWTFEAKILNTVIGDRVGIGTTEIVYREPERNGEPYFNRMIVSYGLEKINGKWYIIKDHASSIEKSTDKNRSDVQENN